MKIQLAYDAIAPQTALALTRELKDVVDIFELGTPFLYTYSLMMLRAFREVAPASLLQADLKIIDGGRGLSELAFSFGADMVSVSARTWPKTIEEAVEAAHERNKYVLVDFEGTPEEELSQLAKRIDDLGPDYLCIHRRFGSDKSVVGEMTVLKELGMRSKIALAGGIKAGIVESLAAQKLLPDLLIVGKAVTLSQSPRNALREILEAGEEGNRFE